MWPEIVGYPIRYINETKLYPNFHFSKITFNLRYEIFDRNVAYSYKTLATKYVKSSVSVVFSFAICKKCAVLLFGCNPLYLFIVCELCCYKSVSFNQITLLTKFMFDKNKIYCFMRLKHTCTSKKLLTSFCLVCFNSPYFQRDIWKSRSLRQQKS